MAEIGDFFNRTSKEGFTVNDVTPFLPSIDYVFDDEGFLDSYSVKFNQGYYINRTSSSQVQDKDNQKIDRMDETYSLPLEHEVNYFVELIISADNFLVSQATFTGVSGEGEGGEGTSAVDDLVTDFPHILFDQTDTTVTEFTGYFPICKLKDGSLEEYTQRSNIQLSDRQFRQLGAYADGASALPFVDEGHHNEGTPVRVRSIVAGTGVYITQGDTSIVINSETGAGGASTGACVNIGSAVEVYNDGAPSLDPQEGFEFRTLIGSESDSDQNNVKVSIDPRNGDRILISGGHAINIEGGGGQKVYVDDSIRPFEFRGIDVTGPNISIGLTSVTSTNDTILITHTEPTHDTPTLQEVTDEGSTTTTEVTYGSSTSIGSSPLSVVTKGSSKNGVSVYADGDTTNEIVELKEDASDHGCVQANSTDGAKSVEMGSDSSSQGTLSTYNAAGDTEYTNVGGATNGGTISTKATDGTKSTEITSDSSKRGQVDVYNAAGDTVQSKLAADTNGGVVQTNADDGTKSVDLTSDSNNRGKLEVYNAAGDTSLTTIEADSSDNAKLIQKNSAGTTANQISAKSDTDTYLNAGPVAIGSNSTVAGKALFVEGTTRVQDSSTAGDGKIELGNDATHSIGYSSSKNALNIGAGVTKFDSDHSDYIDFYSNNAASYSAQNAYIIGSSPATGSAILAGSGNSISGHYNVITAGANNTISGKSMNFIGGGSGIDIIDSEFSVSVGGRNNDITGCNWSVIAGGYDNLISGINTNSIGGGYSNQIQGVFASVIAGGYDNLVSGNLDSAGAVVGGVNNKVEKSHYGFIGAGASNTIKEDSDGAVIVGGLGNILKGTNSFIGGGQENAVSGTYGVALGSHAKVRHNGAFVFSDGTPATAFSSGDNSLLMSFKSGVYVQSDSGLYVNGNPVMTGASDLDTDTLQTVTTRGNTTTNNIKVNTFSGAFGFVDVGMCIGPAGSPKAAPAYGLDCEESAFLGGTAIISGNVAGRNTLEVSGDAGGTGFGGRLTLGGTGYLLSGDVAGTESDTLQTVTDRGATTTNDITVADLLVQNNGQVRANGAGSLTLGNTNGGTIYVSGNSTKSIITPRVNHLYLQSNRDEDDIIFQAGEADVEMARFDSANQRFGIGTASPVSRLHIGNATGSTLGLRFTNPTETVNQYFASDATDSDFFITYAGNGGAEITLQHDGKLALNASNGDNVGVGTDNPARKLEVSEGSSSIVSQFKSTAGTSAFITVANTTASADQIRFGSIGNDLVLSTNYTERFRIDSAGNVGIGTTNPSEKLQVSGNILVTGAGSAGPHLKLAGTYTTWEIENQYAGGANNDMFRIRNTALGSDALVINRGNNNVGIGTTNPNAELEIAASVATIRLTDSDLTNTFSEIEKGGDYLYFYSRANSSNGGFLFAGDNGTTETEFMRIATDGDVGIGSNTPSAKLDVAGGIKLLDNNYLTWNSSNTRIVGNSDYLQFQVAASDKVRIQSNGHVGIGSTSPAYVLDTVFTGDQGVRLRSTDNHSSLLITSAAGYGGYIRFGDGPNRYWINATSDDKLRFRPNATSLESATINFDATGNVGIGVLSPSQKLEVGTNTDVSAQIGRAHVGSVGYGDYAGFAHLDQASTSSYALLQGPNGNTFLNCANGQQLYFRRNHVNVGGFNTNSDFYVDTDTLYVDASADSVGINDSTPSYPLDVNGTIRTQSGLLGTQFGTGPCTTIDGFFASTSTEDYGFQNALLMNDLAGFTKWAGVTIKTSGLYKTRGGSAGSYTYSNEATTGDFDRAFQANNHTVGSWYTDSGPDGDITTGVASTGVIELYFNGVKSLNYSAQAAAIFGSASFRATHVKIEAHRTGAWQTILDTTENTKTALIARIASNGGGANATTGLRYSFARAGNYFRINNLYAADYDLGNDLSYGGQYYIDKYYDGRHYADLRPVTDGGANLGTSSVRYGNSYIDYGRFTNNVGIGTDTLTYNLNVVSNSDILAQFKSNDNKASILIQDNDTAGYVSAENDKFSIGPNNGTHTGNLTIDLTNSRVGIGTNAPAYPLDVVGTIHGTSGNFENGITIDGNPVVTGTSAFESDTLQTVTDQGNITTNNIIIENNGNDPEYGALTISGGYALAHLRSTGTVAYLQFQNSTTSYGTMSNNGMTIGNNGHDAYVTNRQALGNLYLGTSGEARVAIKPDGKVGIGSITPQGLLDVKADTDQNIFLGRARFGSYVTDYLYLSHYDNGSSTSYALKQSPAGSTAINAKAGQNVSMSVNNSDIVFVQGSTSNVGIGTTDPVYDLTIGGNAVGSTGGLRINDPSNAAYGAHFSFADTPNEVRIGGITNNVYNDAIGIYRESTRTITIDSSQRVGIGTTNPAQKLHLEFVNTDTGFAGGIGGDWGSEGLLIENTSSTTDTMAMIQLRNYDADFHIAGIRQGTNDNDLGFFAEGSEIVRFTNAGNVGIGTTSPSRDLQIGDGSSDSVVAIVGPTAGLSQLALGDTDDDNYAQIILDNSTNKLQIQNGGGGAVGNRGITLDSSENVGIGTTEPAKKLSVYEAGNAQVGISGTNVSILTISDPNSHGQLNTYNDGTFRINSVANAAGTQLVLSGSNVGVGTIPAKKLDVNGDTRVKNAEFQITSSSAYTTHLNYLDGGNNYISQANGGATIFRNSAGTLMSLNSAGTLNVGAAGVTNTRLHVTGAASDSLAKFKDGSDGVEITTRGASRQQIDFLGSNTSAINAKGSLFINYDSDNGGSNDTITFARNGVDEAGTVDMIITEGKVGIGTTDPAHQLHLNKENAIAEMQISRDGSDPSTDTDIGRIQFKTDYSSSPNEVGSIWVRTNSSAYRTDMRFGVKATAGSEEVGLTIHGTNDGPFVGVGTTNPTQTFHVKAEQDGDYVARITNTEATTGANYGLKVDGGSNASDVTFEASSLAGTSHLKVQGDGKVGIGSTSPARKLDVSTNGSDTYGIRNSYGPSHYMEMAHNRFNTVGNNYIRFNIDDSTKMTIVDSDFGGGVNGVGIGTTSPSYELDVVGTTRSTYYIGGAYLEENASSSKLKFYTDGTVLVMDEDGELKPCEKENDTLVFGVSKRDFDSPVVLGAEPILVTGPIKVGDYIVTSSKQGHGQAMKEEKLGTIIAQAMESGDGESYNIKAMIRKM